MNFKSAQAQYNLWMSVWGGLYVLILVGSILLLRYQNPTGIWLYIIAASPALPIGGILLVFMNYLEKVDEYLRSLLVKRFVITTGLTLFICTFWGFLEANANAPHFALYLVYPLFWAIFGMTCFMRRAS